MVNNEFHLIGIATTNFQEVGNGKFKSYLLRVEVEKMGSKKGQNFELEVQVYGTNSAVNKTQSVVGCQVAINGYIDSYVNKDNQMVSKIVAQNVMVLDAKPKFAEPEQAAEPELASGVWEEIAEESEKLDEPNEMSSEDDLPF